jgi:hypothetical protein
VEAVVTQDQSLLNKLKDGSECLDLGGIAVRKAEKEWRYTVTRHRQAKAKISVAASAWVKFRNYSFRELLAMERKKTCRPLLGSRAYREAQKVYTIKVRLAAEWSGRVRESWKVVLRVREAAKKQVKECACAAKKTRDTLWRALTSVSRRTLQLKAHKKCKQVGCITRGIPLSHASCQSHLKVLVNKKMMPQLYKVAPQC